MEENVRKWKNPSGRTLVFAREMPFAGGIPGQSW
jgi:hypothetical protein